MVFSFVGNSALNMIYTPSHIQISSIEFTETWESKVKRAESIRQQREAVFAEMGVAIKDDGETVGFFQPKKTPHLVNLNPDSSLSECLLYYLKVSKFNLRKSDYTWPHPQVGTTRIGSPEANLPQDIQLVGSHIVNEHCVFENNDGEQVYSFCI